MAKIKSVWVVATATPDSTLRDIIFKAHTSNPMLHWGGTSLWSYILGTLRIDPHELDYLEIHDSKESALKEARRRLARAKAMTT